jgi:hypothetical protein
MPEKKQTGKKVKEIGLPISPKLQSAAEELINSSGIKKLRASNFRGKYFRRHFYPNVANVYFGELIEFTKVKHKLDEKKIVKTLALDYATKKRWLENSHPPAADKIFAIILLILRKNFQNIPFSSPPELIFFAVCRQLRAICMDFCGYEPTCVMSRTAFRTLMYAMSSGYVDGLIPGNGLSKEATKVKLGYVRDVVNAKWKEFTAESAIRLGYSSKPTVIMPPDLHKWIVNWGMPYTLFALGTQKMQWGVTDV